MDKLPPSIPSTPSPEIPNTFLPINRPNSTSSTSTSATRESTSSGSNSPDASTSPAAGNFEGTPVSFIPNPTLPSHLRERILSNTPGTSHFSRENRTGAVHPARAAQAGHPAATIEAAAQRRNPQHLNASPIHIQNPVAARLLAQNRFQQKLYFFPPTTPPKRID